MFLQADGVGRGLERQCSIRQTALVGDQRDSVPAGRRLWLGIRETVFLQADSVVGRGVERQ